MDLEIFSGTSLVFSKKSPFRFYFIWTKTTGVICFEKEIYRLGEEQKGRLFLLVLFSCFTRQHVSLIVIRRSDSERD